MLLFTIAIVVSLLMAATVLVSWMRLFRPRLIPGSPHLPFEEDSFITRDGVRIQGYFLTQKNSQRSYLLCHGVSSNAFDVYSLAAALYNRGHDVFLFDFRGHGKSSGTITSYGYFERHDSVAAHLWVRSKSKNELYTYALSMGGAAFMLALPELKTKNLAPKRVALDSIIALFMPLMWEDFRHWPKPLRLLVVPFLTFMVKTLFGIPFHDITPISHARDLEGIDTIYIHSKKDTLIPYSHGEKLFAALPERKTFISLEDTDHADGHLVYVDRYIEALESSF